ncbi:MAG: ATP-grasp domain-containing protein [Taibaiella sp.]|nr:ATP-grasp domain-containing protein [Taibaiella sp.]
MYILIQSNLNNNNSDFDKIYAILDELKIPFEKIALTDEHARVSIAANRNDVFVYGSVKLAMLGKENTKWYPGSFYGGNHLFEVYAPYYKEHLLNYHTEIKAFGELLNWEAEEQKFIKPYRFAKLFTGKVFSRIKWEDFVDNSLKKRSNDLFNAQSLVQVSIPRTITKEARLWIVDGQIVDAVYYKILKDIPFEATVAPEGIRFAEQMISIFNVAPAFVMDICLTDIGWKIVEINCINSAGFYPNTDIKKVFLSLRDHFKPTITPSAE